MQIIDKTSAAKFVRIMAADWDFLLRHIESMDGYVRLPPKFADAVQRLSIENYPELYESEMAIGRMMLAAFFKPEEVNGLAQQVNDMSPDSRGKFVLELLTELELADDSEVVASTPAGDLRAIEALNALPAQQRDEVLRAGRQYMMALLAILYQLLSLITHGEKLTSLVAQAIAGNDRAFAKAVQIDKNILAGIPYFRQRFSRAVIEGDRHFTEALAAHLQRPPYKGKIRHKALYLTFAVLDLAGTLDAMPHSEILDLCNQAGLDAKSSRIEDVKNLSKRLADYRAFQRRGFDLSTP